MPNQTDPNKPADQPVSPVTSAGSMPMHTDLPPLPPDFQNVVPSDSGSAPPINSTTPSAIEEQSTSSGSAAPPDLPPMVTSSPKKKFGSGKIIATILGLLLLVGGVGTGVYLTQQNQNPNSKAYLTCGSCDAGKSCNHQTGQCEANVTNTNTSDQTGGCGSGYYACSRGCCAVGGTSLNGPGGGGCGADQHLCTCSAGGACVPNATTCTTYCGGSYISDNTTLGPNSNNQIDPNTGNTIDGTPSGNCANNQRHAGDCFVTTSIGFVVDPVTGAVGAACNGPHYTTCAAGYTCSNQDCVPNTTTNSGGPTPTPPTAAGSCQAVKAYSSTWTLLTGADLSALHSGSVINFCVAGTATGTGAFDKGKFTINTVVQAETTTKGSGAAVNDYCQNYTIPTAITTFNVSAQIHHSVLGWF
ncbi:MAG TPA: hypothetical protein VKC53_00890 [Patescibacteria group bacterium]|nr:hypothetical protein [Patescibacteria group bacterium]